MNVPGVNVASVAGTARAQARGSDAESNQQTTASTERRNSPGAASDNDQLSLNASGESDDRDGDGRRAYIIDNEPGNADAEDATEQPQAVDGSDDGEHLDLEA